MAAWLDAQQSIIPAQAGIQSAGLPSGGRRMQREVQARWIPACAGMTKR
jgi:hypothetical protein